MLRRRLSALLLLSVACFASPLTAETLKLHLDPAQSQVSVRFSATLQSVSGRLGPAEGTVEFDPATGKASGAVHMDFTDAETGVGRRDRKMHSRILETDRYPGAVFHVEGVKFGSTLHPGDNDVELRGTVDFHGSSHLVTFPATVSLQGDQVRAKGWLEIPYIAWGVRDPSFFLLRVAKVVTVEVDVAGRLEGRHP
jgi:polyisoprenoid-binding protein YceI